LFTSTRSEKNIALYQKLGYKIFDEEQVTEELRFVYMEKKYILKLQSVFILLEMHLFIVKVEKIGKDIDHIKMRNRFRKKFCLLELLLK